MPSRMTAAPAKRRKCFWKAPLARLETAESERSAGSVPMRKGQHGQRPDRKARLAQDIELKRLREATGQKKCSRTQEERGALRLTGRRIVQAMRK